MKASSETGEYVSGSQEGLSETAVRIALAGTAYEQARRELEGAADETRKLFFDIFMYAKRITIEPHSGCSLTIYRSRAGIDYHGAIAEEAGKIKEGEEFVGERLRWGKDGLIVDAWTDDGFTNSVRLQVDEKGKPEFKVTDIEFELPQEEKEGCRIIMDLVRRDSARRWQTRKSLAEAAWSVEPKKLRFETFINAINWLIYSGQLEQYEDRRVVLAQVSVQ